MFSTIELIGIQIADFLKTFDFSEKAEFLLVPDFDFQEIKDLRILVVPQSFTADNSGSATRGGTDDRYKMNIGICKRVKKQEEITGLLVLTERIFNVLKRKKIGNFYIVSVENDPVYDMNSLRTSKVFVSVLTANIKVL